MAEVIFAEQILSFDPIDEIYEYASEGMLFSFVVNEEYTVVWDEEEYKCTATEVDINGTSIVIVGNQTIPSMGENDTNEPFCMYYIPAEIVGNESGASFIDTADEGESHTIAIYQGTLDEETVGVSIVLYDRTGQAVTFEGVETLTTDTPEDGVTATFTHGELLEGTEIDLSLAEGNQEISVPDGYLVKKATIKKPDNLLPEYIKKGIEIAGVTGNFAGDVAEKTVELNMAEGDQVIEADEDTVLTKVTVIKPDTLLPENIVKDVDIGGVVGTFSGGMDEILKHFICNVDVENNKIIIYRVLYASYEEGEVVVIPDTINGFSVEVYAAGI